MRKLSSKSIVLVLISFILALYLYLDTEIYLTNKIIKRFYNLTQHKKLGIDDEFYHGNFKVGAENLEFSINEGGLTVREGSLSEATSFLRRNGLVKVYDDFGVSRMETMVEQMKDPRGLLTELPSPEDFENNLIKLKDKYGILINFSYCRVSKYWEEYEQGSPKPEYKCIFKYNHRDGFKQKSELEKDLYTYIEEETPEGIEVDWNFISQSFPSDIKGLSYKESTEYEPN